MRSKIVPQFHALLIDDDQVHLMKIN